MLLEVIHPGDEARILAVEEGQVERQVAAEGQNVQHLPDRARAARLVAQRLYAVEADDLLRKLAAAAVLRVIQVREEEEWLEALVGGVLQALHQVVIELGDVLEGREALRRLVELVAHDMGVA